MRLAFEQITIGYPGRAPVLERLTFAIGTGLWVITGRNGAGKTSLLRCAAGVIRPRSGRLLWNGDDAWRDPVRYRWHLGYAPQEVSDLPDGGARDYLIYLAAAKGVRPGFQAQRVGDVMAMVGLREGALATYSAGMKRRLLLAAALLNDPDLLVLDEPTSGLDPEEKVHVRLLLSELAQDRIVLLSTHVVEEMEGVADGWLTVSEKGVTVDGDRDSEPDENLLGRHQGAR